MSSFDNLYIHHLEEMARSSDTADFSKVPEDFASQAIPNRGKANRFGKHQNSDVQPFFQSVVQDFLTRENKKITYAEVSTAIKNILLKGKDRGGMGMGPTFAAKWTQHLADVLFKLLKSVNAAAKEPQSNPEASDVKSGDQTSIDVAPQASSEEEPESQDDTPEETSPEEPTSSDKDLEATAELNLSSDEETLLDIIKNVGGEVSNKQILADPSTPFKLRDDPSKLREVLGGMGRKGLITRGDTGWIVKERQPSDSEAVFDREEDGEDYGAMDTISRYASEYGEKPDFGSQFESYDVAKAFIHSFKRKGLE